MNETERDERRQQIRAAALELLAEVGYRKTSMLQIAKRAQASNQTLYAWYANKQGLFRGVIEDAGQLVTTLLEEAVNSHEDPLQALENLGPVLLRFTTDTNAIIMNRAAVIDVNETGVLADAIDQVGRARIYPLICSLMQLLVDAGVFRGDTDADDAAQTYVALLFGEAQLRQVLGKEAPYDESEIARRAARAFSLTCRLYQNF
jgi:AcrR family transcriptional regulator